MGIRGWQMSGWVLSRDRGRGELAVPGERLDSIVSKVFSNRNSCIILDPRTFNLSGRLGTLLAAMSTCDKRGAAAEETCNRLVRPSSLKGHKALGMRVWRPLLVRNRALRNSRWHF